MRTETEESLYKDFSEESDESTGLRMVTVEHYRLGRPYTLVSYRYVRYAKPAIPRRFSRDILPWIVAGIMGSAGLFLMFWRP